ncbi:MAG: glycosyltransferase family 4 protein [Fervidobacterium sp.]|uniref:glycosyltransferase family 4 protein n=1 Tax=Fervidobacterium sp. TaxID=1871331 RepID=UPI00404A136B
MKIVHVVIPGPFTEDASYQENFLVKENKKAGHDVTVITSCYKWEKGYIIKVPEEDKIIYDGVRLIRLEYDKILNEFVSSKIRSCHKLIKYLYEIEPDVIFQHGIQSFTLFDLVEYKKKNPRVKLYVDSHSDLNNSAKNFLSRYLLHKMIYKPVIRRTFIYFDKIFYVSYEAKDFLVKMYGLPEYKLEFYPLGGIVLTTEEKKRYRAEKRAELGMSDEDILLCHSGKIDRLKRTYELVQHFQRVKNENLRLIIIGTFLDGLEKKIMPLIESDTRIKYLGWKSSDDLIKYIAASDLYVQPGSQSVTMQVALCAGTPVLFSNAKSHQAYMKGNAFMFNEFKEMEDIFRLVSENPGILRDMSKRAFDIAKELLDYKKLAERITI